MAEAADSIPRLRNFIDGVWIDSLERRTTLIVDPANGEHLWHTPDSTPTDMVAALRAGVAAARLWRRSPASERSSVLLGAAAYLADRSAMVATDLSREQGKTQQEADREVASTIECLRYFAGQTQHPVGDLLPRSASADRIWTERVPLGLVVCLTPWNFPILIPAYKVAPALAFGNAVVLKPASLTPRSATYLIEALEAAGLPAGVANLCLGRGTELIGPVIEEPGVRGISFTGSTDVGRSLKSRTAHSNVHLQLEMGGKNAILVLEDADPKHAAQVALRGAMGMAGQRCTALSRAVVDRKVAVEFKRHIVEGVSALRVGQPRQPDVDMGPVISEPQRKSVIQAISQAEADGARVLVRGTIQPDSMSLGHFVAPVVIGSATPSMDVAQREIFGPVLAVIEVRSTDQAIEVANSSVYGLAASVSTSSIAHVMRAIEGLDVGVIHFNRPAHDVERYAPFGGKKASGFGGREQGQAARDFFTEYKTVYLSAKEQPLTTAESRSLRARGH